MKKRDRILVGSLAAAASVVLILGGFYVLSELRRPRTFYDTGISDEEYIAITNQTMEAQKFLEKYPNATIFVDRSGALAVDYRIETALENGTTAHLRLRIFIDWKTNQPSDRFLDCSGTYIQENLVEHLETETCLE